LAFVFLGFGLAIIACYGISQDIGFSFSGINILKNFFNLK
jgi:hypothetical protein